MQLVTEMALPHLPVEQPQFEADPMPFIEVARRQHPWLAKCNIGYVIHGYQAIKDILYMDDKMRPSFDGVMEIYGVQGTPYAAFQEGMIINQSGRDHARVRDSVASAFTPRNVNRFRPLMRQTISDLLDEWAPKRAFDFTDFAARFPIAVLCGLMGTSTDVIPSIMDALETQGLAMSMKPEVAPLLVAGFDVQWNFADKLIVEREKSGVVGDGLLDALIAAKNAGQMDDRELRYLLMVLFVAGYDTSKNMLTLTMNMMLTRPDQWERCAADRPFCDKVIEEIFRHTSTATPFRTAKEEVDYDGVRFPKDSLFVFACSLAGRDPASFTDAAAFQPERVHTNRHVAFGRGAHICLGQHLARTQLAEGLHMIAQRITKPKLAGEVTWRPFLGTWGIRTLPIEFEPANA